MANSLTNSSRNASAERRPRISTALQATGADEKIRGRLLANTVYQGHTIEVARELLGKILWVKSPAGLSGARIVETEAYREDDAASHSCRGETPRSAIMFQKPGFAYVYFIYGMYEMLNFVTEPRGKAGAVLIRAAEPIAGLELMRTRRGRPMPSHQLLQGPGKLCRAMGIQMSHNGQSLRGPQLFVTDDGFVPDRVSASPRVGISKALDKYWRFFITGSASVSRAPQNREARILK